MATKRTKRCIGSPRFGIEPHEAKVSEFGKHNASPDGLSRMCREHWRAYRAGLAGEPEKPKATAKAVPAKADGSKSRRSSTPKSAAAKARRASAERAKAAALVAEVDAMPADEAVERVGDDDVQAALETVATGRDAA